AVGSVVLIDIAAADHPNSERVDVVRRDHLYRCAQPHIWIRRLARDVETRAELCTLTGKTRGHGNLRHTWNSPDFFEHLSVVRPCLVWSIKTLQRYRQAKSEDVACFDTEIDSRQIPKTSQRKTTGRQQCQRERKLGDYKHAQSVASHSTSARASSEFQNFIQIDSRCLPRRRSSKQQPGKS